MYEWAVSGGDAGTPPTPSDFSMPSRPTWRWRAAKSCTRDSSRPPARRRGLLTSRRSLPSSTAPLALSACGDGRGEAEAQQWVGIFYQVVHRFCVVLPLIGLET